MALGALISAYQEDDSGGLRAMLPLAGRTLLEYQARCVAAAGAAPVVVLVDRLPQGFREACERLRLDGIGVFPVSDINEAVSRFEAGSMILVVGDGVVPPAELVAQLAEEMAPAVATVPDDEAHAAFERIDAQARWAGVAAVDARLLGSTAAMLGDWDLQSTLLRRTIQEGAIRVPVGGGGAEPLLADSAEQLEGFQRGLIHASRGSRNDWASRFLLPPVEELATIQLLETSVRPGWLIWTALALTLGAGIAFTRGWLGAGLAMLVLSAPLDLVAARLATLRLRPLPARLISRSALWPAAGAALAGLGWWLSRDGEIWGTLVTTAATLAFAEARRMESAQLPPDLEVWLFSRRNAIFAAIPFALAGAWTAFLLAMLVYAAVSFFLVQHLRNKHSS
jgi:hypothetical protein